MTGADFSQAAIEQARALAAEVGVEARFVQSDLYDLPEHLEGDFDIVYTSRGVLGWLPDIDRWAQVAAHFVRPGGRDAGLLRELLNEFPFAEWPVSFLRPAADGTHRLPAEDDGRLPLSFSLKATKPFR